MDISFECYCPTQWGQSIFVTGSVKELGNWDVDKALPLNSITTDKWKTIVKINSKAKISFEYKYFMKDENQRAIFWEFEGKREFSGNVDRFNMLHIKDLWKFHGNIQYTWTKSAFSNVIFKRKTEDAKRYVLPAKAKSIIEFKIVAPRVGVDYYIGVLGNCKELGNWNESQIKLLNSTDFPTWKIALAADEMPQILEYKYVIVNKKTNKIATWEFGENRLAYFSTNKDIDFYRVNENIFRYPNNDFKGAGVSIPVFSIRTENSFGVGDFLDLKKMVDWASKTHLKMIQVLPINDTISTHSFLDSYPYKAISVFALHPLFLNIFKVGKLNDEVLLNEYAKLQLDLNKKESVDYDLVVKLKIKYAQLLFKEKQSSFLKSKDFSVFFKANKMWLESYAAFSYLRDKIGTSDFNQWGDYKEFNSKKVKDLLNPKSKEYGDLAFWFFIQFHLDKQLQQTVEYARNKGIVLKGDIPIGISRYSADAWFEPGLYHFEGQAGAPPDDFSIDGQNWGFPTYNWEEMEKDNYKWWRNRLTKMAEYFDAYRIDHILGFFRIWEIPFDAVQGILGHFRPAMPFNADELKNNGIWLDFERMCKPYIRGHFLFEIFGSYTEEVVERYLKELDYNIFELKEDYNTQRLIYDYFVSEAGPESLDEKEKTIMWGLIRLAAEVIFLPADGKNESFHPRISMHSTYSYKELDHYQKEMINKIYIHYFYHRHEQFWKNQALEKLPAVVEATNMLVCGEDLGMIPATVPEVMNQFGVLSLEIQRMPKDPKKDFAHPADAPYMSVCTTSTHDMSTIRGWWEENRALTQLFFNQQLGNWGEMPYFAEPWVCRDMILQHLHSPAMWTVFPLQDLLAMDEKLRSIDTHGERINEPANPRHYWKYRMHLSVEDLVKATDFNKTLTDMIKQSGRDEDY